MKKKHFKNNTNVQHDEQTVKKHKEYMKHLKERFGDDFRKSKDGANSCPFQPTEETVISSEEEFNSIKEKYENAYKLTKENLGKHITGLTRRNFLKLASTFLAAAALPLSTSSCDNSGDLFDNSEGQSGCAVPGENDTALVSMVRKNSIEESVRRAVEMAGGLDEIQVGESIVIKPNCVWHSGKQSFLFSKAPDAPVTTNPEVLRAVIRILKEKNQAPEKIFIADHGAFLSNTMKIFIEQGMYDVAMEEGANVLSWEDTDHIQYKSDKFEYMKHPVRISTTLKAFDHFINVPVIKNHELNVYPRPKHQAQYTCCLKAFVGVIHPHDRLFNKRMFHEYDLPRKIAELNLCRPYKLLNGRPGITMNIVDATSIIVEGGPHNSIYHQEMKVESPNIILASKDRIACDTAALSVLKHYGISRCKKLMDYISTPVWDQPQIVHAAYLGLGINDRERIEFTSEGIEGQELTSIMRMWNHTEPITKLNKKNYI